MITASYYILAAIVLTAVSLGTHLRRWNRNDPNDQGARPGIPFAVLVLLIFAFLDQGKAGL